VPKRFFFEKPNEIMSFLRSAFQSTLLKHAGEVFFVLGNADFFKFKNASELFSNISLVQNKILCILVFCNSAYFL